MKALGLVLIIASFLGGAFLTSLDPLTVQWNWMVPALVLGLAGLWVHRRAQHSELRSGHRLAGDIRVLEESLEYICVNLDAVCARGDDLPVYEARFEIDRLFRDDLARFADARESMVHVFGMQNYADVMSNFAAGERYINRVWSASTDGYVDEVRMYLGRAQEQFREAREHFGELVSRHAGTAGAQSSA